MFGTIAVKGAQPGVEPCYRKPTGGGGRYPCLSLSVKGIRKRELTWRVDLVRESEREN